jgi:hypothetical protein
MGAGTVLVAGLHHKVEMVESGDAVRERFGIFGQTGYTTDGPFWAISTDSGKVELVAPTPIKAEIEQLIRQHSAIEPQIQYIGLSALAALRLALEEVLTPYHLQQSVEDAGSITVRLSLAGTERKVRITQAGLLEGPESKPEQHDFGIVTSIGSNFY